MRGLVLILSTLLASALVAADTDPILIEARGKFPTLVNPDSSFCKVEAKRRKDDLRPDDRVLCWTRGKNDGGAIPIRFFLHPYPVISDTYGVFVHDANAGFARGFEPSPDFVFYGWRNGIMVIEHKDGTLFSALSGVAFAGKRKGTQLKPVPTITSEWGWWTKRYPETVAYHMFNRYVPKDVPLKQSVAGLKSRGKADPRLSADERVLGLRVGTATKAYRLADLHKAVVLADKLGDHPCVLLYHAATKTAAAYSPIATPPLAGPKARVLTISATKEGGFTDKQTGSTWDIAGRGVAGPLQGWTLGWLDGVEVKWYAWSAEFPTTRVYAK
jgi:Protein of unknown function (DUF3179)